MSRKVTLFASAVRTVTEASEPVVLLNTDNYSGVWLHLSVTANSGTAETLDVILQRQDPVTGTWLAIPGAVFVQIVVAGVDELTVHPSMTAAANIIVKEHIGGKFRALATIAGTTPSFTFSLSGYLLR